MRSTESAEVIEPLAFGPRPCRGVGCGTARRASAPTWPRRPRLFCAIVVTLVLWLPDLYILYRGQPPPAVAVLMVMHLAIAVVTYNVLVRAAPVGPLLSRGDRSPERSKTVGKVLQLVGQRGAALHNEAAS